MRDSPVVAFVMEQHVGHRTFAENLKSSLPDDLAFEVDWVPITYERSIPSAFDRLLPGGIAAAMNGRAQVREGMRSVRPDAAIFNTQVPAALGGRIVRSQPYVVITDVTPMQYDRMAEGYGHSADRPGPLRAWKHRANQRVFRNAVSCVGWSSWVCRSLHDDYGVPESTMHVIPPGVDTYTWAPTTSAAGNDDITIVFVGGDFERKGGFLLLEAFESLSIEARLVLVTKSAPAHLGPRSDRITVVDDVSPNDSRLRDLYATADIFALPSLAETFGIAVVEASASGLPVVATRVGAFSDIVEDGETGFLVDPGDPIALAAAIRALADDEGLRARLGHAGRKRVMERFDSSVNSRRLVEVVGDALGMRARKEQL